jgi:hypothetical protein
MPQQFETDADGLPTKAFLDSLDTKEKWEHFLDTADERSALHGFIYLNNLVYGEPE